MTVLSGTLSLSAVVVFLSLIQISDLRPTPVASYVRTQPPCKDGSFYVESVFAYFNCSICVEQSHYINCNVCCPASATAIPTPSISTPKTKPSVTSLKIKLPPSSKSVRNH
ncbi:hypothetical protein OS493_013209 [Desmophyllum pertusum]|uniref:Uncharacterized protein n=1 Tax=Desmophyllum pertusum TaxID=174260 RepID=A0A9W9YT11_9CNID|nr:hypothetical protein OS493_013209 [Desmophyllum pertusum]